MVFPETSPRSRTVLCALLVLVAVLLVFLPSVRFALIDLDDDSYIARNSLVTSGLSWRNIRDAFATPGPASMYIPLLWVSYMADVTLFGASPASPAAFHAVNVAFHALGALLLFLLLLRLSRRPLPAALLALLWALHPLRVESVAWVTERKDVLAVFFCLLSIHAWLPALSSPRAARRILWTALSLLAFALGLLVKPSLVPLPLFLAALAISPPPDPSPAAPAPPPARSPALLPLLLLPFLLLAALAAFGTIATHAASNSFDAPPLLVRIATIPSVLLFYLSKFLLPRRLAVIYPLWSSSPLAGILLAIPFAAAALWIFRLRRRLPFLGLGALFAALFISPVCGLVPVPFNLVADRFTILPSIGISLALLSLFPACRPARLPLAFLALLVAACAIASVLHLPVWRSTAAVYAPVRRLLPDHRALCVYDAQIARVRGDFALAHDRILRALAAGDSDYSLMLSDSANLYNLSGPRAALDLLLANPPPLPAFRGAWHVLVAASQLALRLDSDALATAASAAESVPPSDSLRRYALFAGMIAAHRLGLPSRALAFARSASALPASSSSLSPADFLPFYVYIWNSGFRDASLEYFRSLAADFPDRPDVLNNIAWILATPFWSPAPPSEAIALSRAAIAAAGPEGPANPSLLDTLAAALANASRFDEAADTLAPALDALPPGSPSRPPLAARLDLYRRHLPYREFLGRPAPLDLYPTSAP